MEKGFGSLDKKRADGRKKANKRLEDAIKIHGFKDWTLISKYIMGRTDVQCRERAMNSLNPSIKQTNWTEAEEKLLCDLVDVHGIGHWSRIAEEISGRTDNQCSRRYFKITDKKKHGKKQQPLDQRRRKKEKKTKKKK